MNDILEKKIVLELVDGSQWSVSVKEIANHRAKYYGSMFENNIEKSLERDTIPRFSRDIKNAARWAIFYMNWNDFSSIECVRQAFPVDYSLMWENKILFVGEAES